MDDHLRQDIMDESLQKEQHVIEMEDMAGSNPPTDDLLQNPNRVLLCPDPSDLPTFVSNIGVKIENAIY